MRKRSNGALDFSEYKATGERMPERIAHALDWAAKKAPKQFVAYNILLKAVMGYTHTPMLRSNEIKEQILSRMSRVRTLLHRDYGRGLTAVKGVGVRATVDSEDQLKTEVVAASRRVASANKGLVAASSLVDASEIPITAENKPWLNWYQRDLRHQVAMISDPNYLKRLLPPEEKSEKKEDDVSSPSAKTSAG